MQVSRWNMARIMKDTGLGRNLLNRYESISHLMVHKHWADDYQIKNKIIPVFKRLHGPEYQALIMVDNSQGHSTWPKNALHVQNMNLNPSGKVPCIHDGWFICTDGVWVSQLMVFPPNHPTFPNQPKGMKAVLQEHSLCCSGMLLICQDETKCEPTATTCCATRVLEHQPNFLAQKSLVQETIEAAGHLCIFLPKFHCELNFIEYFWGAVKCYLREHCNYTHAGLQENLPKAIASVDISTIRK